MAARIVSQSRWPYLSSQLFSLKLVEVPHSEIQTMAVDKGWRMYYSPTIRHGTTCGGLSHRVTARSDALCHAA